MKILMVHKFYYIEGGAERYVFNVSDLLRQKGHTVIPFAMQDERNFPSEYSRYFADRFGPDQLFMTRNPLKRIQIARRVIYNREAQRKLDQLIKETRPDIAHVHSVYHHLSPSVLSTLKEHNLPVMMTLHDYKIICPNYILMDGSRRVCEACRGKSFWKATAKKCFRDSYAASALVSLEAYVSKLNKSYSSHVDLFMSPSRFLGDRVAAYGYQPVRVQPYTLDLTEYQPGYQPENYFLFMGRLTHEKGLHFLIDAARQIRNTELYIVGTGPLANELRERISREKLDHVKMIGYKSGTELRELVRRALFTVVTSEWHDNSPLVIYEALALGKPVIGAKMGGIPELIEDGVDGYIYERGDVKTFVDRVQSLVDHRELAIAMGNKGRLKAEKLYDFEHHYEQLMKLYDFTQKTYASGK